MAEMDYQVAQSQYFEFGLSISFPQILEVNGHKFSQIYYNKALEILRGTTHLSIVVKSNLQGLWLVT